MTSTPPGEDAKQNDKVPEVSKKSIEELQNQWAEGIDIWKNVPLRDGIDDHFTAGSTAENNLNNMQERTMSIMNFVKSDENINNNKQELPWPEVVKHSTLYGFGAYNPRGQTYPDDINERQHNLLKNDIEAGIGNFQSSCWWDGKSIWNDGSSECGFVLAFNNRELDADILQKAEKWVVDLATKYDQGAIYKYMFVSNKNDGGVETTATTTSGRLMRETIAVLDPGTDALVEIVRNENDELPSFLQSQK